MSYYDIIEKEQIALLDNHICRRLNPDCPLDCTPCLKELHERTLREMNGEV